MIATDLKLTEDQFSQLITVYNETYNQFNDDWKAEYHTKKKLEGIVSQAKIHTYCVDQNKARKAAKKLAPKVFPEVIREWAEILIEQTKDLKTTYLEWTEKWAGEQVVRNIERRYAFNELNRSEKAWSMQRRRKYEKEGLWTKETAREYDRFYQEQKFFYESPAYFFNHDEFLVKALQQAEDHYFSGIAKISQRLVYKNMTPKETKILYGRVKVNIELTFVNDKSMVKAWTIIASGPIQRPHYRYLVK